MAIRTERAAAQLERGVAQVEDTLESLATSLGDALGERLPALAERLADRFPDVADQLAERLGDRVPALQRYTRKQTSTTEDAFAFIGGLLMGALAGAVAAFLLAPSDGKSLRARIQQRVDGLMGYTPPPETIPPESAPSGPAPSEPVTDELTLASSRADATPETDSTRPT
jgi:ABC-type transporter Mla subunit MlaD